MIIALMGNDGSGKTTVIKLLLDRLVKSGKETIYVPGFDHLFLDKFKSLIQKSTGMNVGELQEEYDNNQRKKARLIFYIWPYMVFMDCVCLLIKYFFRPGKIVIFDRYFYDYVISFKNLGISSKLEEFLFLFLPRPKISFVLDVSAGIAYERKKVTHAGTIDYYENQRLRYLWLAKNKSFPVINTDRTSSEEIAAQIFNEILKSANSLAGKSYAV